MQLVALFSPEHGISGRADDKVSSSKDPTTGLPTYSLYGESLRPTDEMLAGIDTLVFDIQDAGVRFYTYTVTMAYAMEEAAKHHIAFYVLDRPNLLGGDIIEGPMLDADKTNFVGYLSAADSLRAHHRRAGAILQHGESHRMRFARHCDEKLASQLFFREHGHSLGSSIAESADGERIDSLSGNRNTAKRRRFRRPRHADAVRGIWRAMDGRRRPSRAS